MSSSTKRKLVLGGLAAAAGMAGVGAAWWRSSARPDSAEPGGDGLTEVASGAFWRMSFDAPDGQALPMSALRGGPLLLNFWATWCPPCVEELPLIDRFYQQNKAAGWRVLGLAVDQPSAVRKSLQDKPLSFPVGMAGFGGTELSKSLGNLSGGLPFSVVFSSTGALLQRKAGKLVPDDLANWARLG